MEKIWDYNNSIVSIANTCFAFAGLQTHHMMDGELLEQLHQKNCKQLFVLLVDGMGYNNLIYQGFKDSYLIKHCYRVVDTVYPPTTTAATTAFLTGKYPCETNWVSWGMYEESVDDVLIPFLDIGLYSKDKVSYHYFYEKHPIYDPYVEEDHCDYYYPSWSKYHGVKGLDGLCKAMVEENKTKQHKLVYFYYDELDALMHRVGPSHEDVHNEMLCIQEKIHQVVQQLDQDACLLVIADHGQVDCTAIDLDGDVTFNEMISKVKLADSRLLSVDVKDTETFTAYMNVKYKDDIRLYTKKEVMDHHLFGGEDAKINDAFINQLGDYLLVPIDKKTLFFKNHFKQPGSHSGMHLDEIEIPVLLFQGERK